MATVPHVTAWAGGTKYHGDEFLLDWVYIKIARFEGNLLSRKCSDALWVRDLMLTAVTGEHLKFSIWNVDSP